MFALVALAGIAGGQNSVQMIGGQPYHPYRKVGENYYNLEPLYKWLSVSYMPASMRGRELTKHELAILNSPRPLTAWIGRGREYNGDYYRVELVLDDGIVVSRISGRGLGYLNSLLLLNYPSKAEMADGMTINFLAIKTGVRSIPSLKRTLEVYDYGIPCDPVAVVRESSLATNSVATNSVATNSVATNNVTKRDG